VQVKSSATTGFLGEERLVVRVSPAEPWNAPAVAVAPVYVANILRLSLTAMAALSLVTAYAWSWRRRPEDETGPIDAIRLPGSAAWEAPPAGLTATQARAAAPISPRDSVLGVYLDAVRDVEARTGVRARASWTPREFLRASAARRRSPAFSQITALAERALYSSRPETKDILPVMLGLRHALTDELRSVDA